MGPTGLRMNSNDFFGLKDPIVDLFWKKFDGAHSSLQ